MGVSFYDLIHSPTTKDLNTASRRLMDHGLQGEDFFTTKYLLLPIDFPTSSTPTLLFLPLIHTKYDHHN